MWIKSSWSQNVDEMDGITQNKKKWTDFDVCWKCLDYFIVCRYNSALEEWKRRRRSTKKCLSKRNGRKLAKCYQMPFTRVTIKPSLYSWV